MAKQQVKATDADIEEARAALVAGQAELVRLREAFLNDAGVEWKQVKAQEGVIEFAEAQIERLARARARYEEQERQGELGKLRAEMDAHAVKAGDHFVDLLKAVETAATAFVAAHVEHNETLNGWRARMLASGVKQASNVLSTHKVDQGLSISEGGRVRAGLREFAPVYSGQVLQELPMALMRASGIGAEYFTSGHVGNPTLDELYARVGATNQELAGIPEGALFYRHANGAVHMRGPENAIPAEDLHRLELKPISRAEAVGE